MTVLLSLPQATVTLADEEQKQQQQQQQQQESLASGELRLSALPDPRGTAEPKLVLSVGESFRYRLQPSSLVVRYSLALNTLSLPPLHPSTPPLTVHLPLPATDDSAVEQQALIELLDQVVTLERERAVDRELEGKWLAVDEQTGEVLGELIDDNKDDQSQGGHRTPPVGGIVVTAVPEDERDDWLLKSASVVSKNMLTGAGWVSGRLERASEAYVARATPRAEPVKLSPGTRETLERVNGVTTTGKDGVKRVTGFLNGQIQRATEYTFDKGQTAVLQRRQQQQSTPPPVFGPDGELLPTPPPPAPPPGKRPLVSRLLLAGDVLLTSVEASTGQVFVAGASGATRSIAHKYGHEAGEAAGLAGGSVRNVGVAFVDARGVGRRALLKGAGKSFVKTQAKKEAGKSYASRSGSTSPCPDDGSGGVGGINKEELPLQQQQSPLPPPSYPAAMRASSSSPRSSSQLQPPLRPPSSSSLSPTGSGPSLSPPAASDDRRSPAAVVRNGGVSGKTPPPPVPPKSSKPQTTTAMTSAGRRNSPLSGDSPSSTRAATVERPESSSGSGPPRLLAPRPSTWTPFAAPTALLLGQSLPATTSPSSTSTSPVSARSWSSASIALAPPPPPPPPHPSNPAFRSASAPSSAAASSSSASATSPSALAPLPPPPRRRTPLSPLGPPTSTSSRTAQPGGSLGSIGQSQLQAPSPVATTTTGASATGWRRPSPTATTTTMPAPPTTTAAVAGLSSSSALQWTAKSANDSINSSSSSSRPGPAVGRRSGWTRPAAPTEDDFAAVGSAGPAFPPGTPLGKSVIDASDEAVGGQRRKAPPPPPPLPSTASKPALAR